ncbi:hypothetical protein CANCADRAFT_131167 [Tortispora caseinolytica NRRL Y-17796]|uniref:Homoserine dehydrogenase n=1 Tax=Tortispora caseinolytica NRRL Y-17796 TaxID=767744 RepID=A0A1E4TAX4_9ASCO|nr:hypothetical protein CANCADRAFT_131167 [Tortispora caseinolytica NRRL Y-17796]
MTSVNLAIVGVGLVGKAFVRQLQALNTDITFNVIFLARSSGAIYNKDFSPLPIDKLLELADNLPASDLAKNPSSLASLLSAVAPAILVDNTSDEVLAKAYPEFLAKGISIATPNKKGFSSDYSLWTDIFANATKGKSLVYHEATVGAGLPVISTVKDLIITGDKIRKIEGIFSGTLSYIFNEFGSDSSAKFSSIVTIAKEKGFTEPDPRDDLNGMDVARKLTILGRLAGLKIDSPSAFPIKSLIPAPLEIEGITADDFMTRLPDYDSDMDALRADAAKDGKVLRYVGKVEIDSSSETTDISKAVSVGIEVYPASHPFAALQGADNVVAIYTERYGNLPLIVQGAGAGADVTAMGVLADAIKVAQRIAK